MTRTKAKPHRGDDENTFADRIAKIMFSGNADRKTQSKMKTNHRVGETTMTTEEVGAAAEARKLYSEIKGTKKQRPWKIVEEVVGKTVGRFFKCRYHDVGYGGQDEGIHDRGSRVVWDNGPNPLYLQIGSSVFQFFFADFLIVLR